MAGLIQASFARGEIAPALYGRVDTAIYKIALKTARNVIPHAYGGVSNRPGTQFIGPVGAHADTVRLIDFKFKTTDTYVVELGSAYARFIRNDAHVTETALTGCTATAANPVVVTKTSHGLSDGDEVYLSGFTEMTQVNTNRYIVANKTANTFELTSQADGTDIDGSTWTAETTGGSVARIYEISTPYDDADLAELKYTQTADVMTLTHPDYDVYELTRTDHAAWTLTAVTFAPDQVEPTALTASQDGTTGSTSYKYKVTAINEDDFEESLPALSATTSTPESATAANPVVVTDTGHGFSDGDIIEISGFNEMTEVNGRRFVVANKMTNTYELKDEDGSGYDAETTGGTATLTHFEVTDGNATLSAANHIDISWTAASGAGRYVIYKYEQGIYGELGQTEETSFIDDGSLEPDLDSSPPRFREPFYGTDNKPAATGYYQQRQVFGGSNNNPDRSTYSQTGAFDNLTVSTPAKADDAITATLTGSEVDEIRHYVPLDDLIVLTSGGEWRIHYGQDNAFTADTIQQDPQSRWGASHVPPVVAGRSILFVQENDAAIRSIGYALEVDGYKSTEMSLLAHHLFENVTVVERSYARSPDPVVAYVLSDGTVATLTFHEEQEVIAWAHWDTRAGKFKSTAAIRPSATATHDAHYFVVERTINGNTVQYIEKLHPRYFASIEDAFFVDSGLTYDTPITITGATAADPVVITAASHGFSNGDEVDISDITWEPDYDAVDNETQPSQLNGGRYKVANKTANTFELTDPEDDSNIDGSAFNAYKEGGKVRLATATFTGLDHLEGEVVIALGDGNVVRTDSTAATLTVANGSITLDRKFSRLHVGKIMIADVELLDIEISSTRGSTKTVQGERKSVPQVITRFKDTVGCWAGPDSTQLSEMRFREDELMGQPTQPFTGTKRHILTAEWNTHGRVFYRQRDPLPMTILGVVPKNVQVEDDD